MEGECSTEMSADFQQSTKIYIQEDRTLAYIMVISYYAYWHLILVLKSAVGTFKQFKSGWENQIIPVLCNMWLSI
jgi:hypothetical protein